jgi:hypothetical protein
MTLMTIKKYNNVKFDDCGRSISIDEVRSFQKLHKLLLPDDYVNFLCVVNGGTPTPSFFSLNVINEESENELIECEVEELFRLTWENDTSSNLERMCRDLIFLDVPDSRSFLMIGGADSGNLYIATCRKYFGNIFCGSYAFGSEPDGKSIVCQDINLDDELFHIYEEDIVATSFSSFLLSLH